MIKKIFTLILAVAMCAPVTEAFAEDIPNCDSVESAAEASGESGAEYTADNLKEEISDPVLLLGNGTLADGYMLDTDFTGSTSTAAKGFEKWYKGASYGAALGKLYAETGVYSNAADNMSVRIESTKNAKTNLKIYLRQSVSLTGDFSLGARLATEDKKADKSIALGVRTAAGEEKELDAIKIATDGALYAFGEQLSAEFEIGQWHGIELESAGDKILVYIDGEFFSEIPAQDISEITYIECLLTNKVKQADSSQICIDDIYLKSGSARETSRIAISSEKFSVDTLNRVISEIPKETDAAKLLSGIEAPNGEALSLETADGLSYTDASLVPGLYLSVTSADGVNRVRYYIDTLGLKITGCSNGDVLRIGSINLGIDINSSEGIGAVDYYVNEKLIGTSGSAPYGINYEFKAAGSYEIYAVVKIGEESFASPKITVTYKPNKAPDIKLSVKSTELSDGETLEAEADAADEDGEIVSCVLVIDGTEYSSDSDSSPYTFSVDNLGIGSHNVYARAADNDGSETESAPVQVTVRKSGRRDISICDFNKGGGEWLIWGNNCAASYQKNREDFGLSYCANVGAAADGKTTAAVVLQSASSLFSQATINAECDFMIDDTDNTTIELFILNSKSGQFDTADSIKNGSIGGKTIKPGEWHHMRYEFSLIEKRSSLYLDGELIGTKASLTTDGTFNNLRFNISNFNPGKDVNFYMDNAEIYASMEYPYVKNIEFLNSSGRDASKSDNTAAADLNKVILNFNTYIEDKYITKDNFTLFVNGRKYSLYDVSCIQQGAVTSAAIVLRGNAVTSSKNRIIVSGNIADRFGQSSGTEQTVEFNVAPGGFDVSEWAVYNGNKKILQSVDIKKGDEITVSASFVNNGKSREPVWLIMAVYNGDELKDYRIKSIDPQKYGYSFNVSERFAAEDISKGISIEGYVWSADLTKTKSACFSLGQ